MIPITKINHNPKKESMVMMGDTQTGKTEHGITHTKIISQLKYDVLVLDLNRKFTKIDPSKVIHNLSDITGKGLEILQPIRFTTPDAMGQFFSDLCYIAQSRMLTGNFVFVVDELQEWFDNQWTQVKAYETYVRTCHNHCSSFIAIFQSASEIPKYVLRNAVHKFCLYIDAPGDVTYLSKLISKEVQDFSLGKFPKYTGIYKRSGEPTQRFRVVKID